VLEQARVHFRHGVDLYRARTYQDALAEFRTAYELRPNYIVLYNMAQACLELQDYGHAVEYLTRYLGDGASHVPSKRLEEAKQTLRSLEARVAKVQVIANRAGAEVFVDDLAVGRAPLASELLVSAGRHTVSASMPGLPSVEQVIDIKGGEPARVALEFVPARRAELTRIAPPGPSTEPQVRDWSSNPVFISAAVATAAFAAGAITMSVLTVVSDNNYEAARDTLVDAEMLDQLRGQTENRALAADLLWGATLASGAVATVIFMTSGAPERQSGAASARLIASPTRLTLKAVF
jgi:hypothetical protein